MSWFKGLVVVTEHCAYLFSSLASNRFGSCHNQNLGEGVIGVPSHLLWTASQGRSSFSSDACDSQLGECMARGGMEDYLWLLEMLSIGHSFLYIGVLNSL